VGEAEGGPEDDGAHGAFEDDAEAGADQHGPDKAPRGGVGEAVGNGVPGLPGDESDEREKQEETDGAHAGEDGEKDVVGTADVELLAVFRVVFADEAFGEIVAEAEAEIGIAVEGFVDDGSPPDEAVEVVVAFVMRVFAAIRAPAGGIGDGDDALVEGKHGRFFPGDAQGGRDGEYQNYGDNAGDGLGDGETPASANGEPTGGDEEGEEGCAVVHGDDGAGQEEGEGGVPEAAAGFEAQPEEHRADGDESAGEVAFEIDDRVAAEGEDVEEEVGEALEEEEKRKHERATEGDDGEKNTGAAGVAGEILAEVEKRGVVNEREVAERHEAERADIEGDAERAEDDPREDGDVERVAAEREVVAPGGLDEKESAGEEEREFGGEKRKPGAERNLGEAAVADDVAGADDDEREMAEGERLRAGEKEEREEARDGGGPDEAAVSDVDREPHGDDRRASGEKAGAPDGCEDHRGGADVSGRTKEAPAKRRGGISRR